MTKRIVHIPVDSIRLEGSLEVPSVPQGIVLFAHRSQSSRHNRQDNHVAATLRARGLATLLFDQITEEEADRGACFDASLLAQRVFFASDWIRTEPAVAGLPLGYFCSGMGGAAVLICAARRGEEIRAVVCKSARTDLARSTLSALHAPTLLLAGCEEPALLELNHAACEELRGPKALQQVGVSDALETLDEIAKAAGDWFDSHLVTR